MSLDTEQISEFSDDNASTISQDNTITENVQTMAATAPRQNPVPDTEADGISLYSHGFSASQLVINSSQVIRDGRIPAEEAEKAFRRFCDVIGYSSSEERNLVRVRLAISNSAGTSAETDYTSRILFDDDPDSSVIHLCYELDKIPRLNTRVNKMRVFSRSLPGFADLTYDVIKSNGWLAAQRAADYEMDVQVACVCFDYADAMTRTLTPTESQARRVGLRSKAKEGRSVYYTQEGKGVEGSAPAQRGVAENVVPNPARLFRSGAGPYGGS